MLLLRHRETLSPLRCVYPCDHSRIPWIHDPPRRPPRRRRGHAWTWLAVTCAGRRTLQARLPRDFVYRTARWGELNKPIERIEAHLGYASSLSRCVRFFFSLLFLLFILLFKDAFDNGNQIWWQKIDVDYRITIYLWQSESYFRTNAKVWVAKGKPRKLRVIRCRVKAAGSTFEKPVEASWLFITASHFNLAQESSQQNLPPRTPVFARESYFYPATRVVPIKIEKKKKKSLSPRPTRAGLMIPSPSPFSSFFINIILRRTAYSRRGEHKKRAPPFATFFD